MEAGRFGRLVPATSEPTSHELVKMTSPAISAARILSLLPRVVAGKHRENQCKGDPPCESCSDDIAQPVASIRLASGNRTSFSRCICWIRSTSKHSKLCRVMR